jgi:hypothetical protein
MKNKGIHKHYQIFMGQEVEGPDRGVLTLFIPKNAINRKLFLDIANKHNITRLYFGAGNDRGINLDVILLLVDIPENFSIFLEIESEQDLDFLPLKFFKRTKIIYVVKTKIFKYLPSVFKIETPEKVHWFDLKSPVTNNLNDYLYLEDTYV